MMEDLLAIKCPNCNSHYSYRISDVRHVPLLLSCGCTLCMACLSQLVRGDHIKCIQCRKKTSICGNLDLREQLPPNYYLLGRLAARDMKLPRFPSTFSFKSFTAAGSARVVDGPVETSPSPPLLEVRCEECVSLASLSCPQCDGHYCTKCFETVHMSSNSMRRHKPVPLSQLNSGPTHCPSHLSNPMDYFCTEDSKCCCSECCITGGHKGHQVVSLSEAAESQRQKLIPLITKAKNGIQTIKATSADIDDRVRSCRKDVRYELGRLEKLFSRSYSLLQRHQQAVTEKFVSTAVSAINPVKDTQAELLARMQEMRSKVKLGEAALKDDYLLVSQCSSLVETLTSDNQPPILLKEDDLCPPKMKFDLIGFHDYLGDNLGSITSNGVSIKAELLDLKDINGITSPANLEVTPTSTRPSSAQSDYRPSSSMFGSGRSSRASSYRSVSPVPPKKNNQLEAVKREDTIEVTVSHIVGIDEFYVQSTDQRRQLTELSEALSSHSPPLEQLAGDAVKSGLRCVALIEDHYYRAHISSVQFSDPPLASLKLIDHGRIEDVPLSSLYKLAPPLSLAPVLCVQCHLHAIQPPRHRRQHHATPTLWSSHAMRVFYNIVDDRSFRMKVYRQSSSSVLSVDLLTFSDLDGDGHCVEESDHSCSSVINQLIERGVAVLDNRKWAEPLTLSINLGAGDCLDVTVPTAENPWDFYVHLVSRERDLQKVLDVLSHHIRRLKPLSLEPFKQMLCVCNFIEDGCWYRAQVKELRGESVLVTYVDYGNSETIGKNELYQLPDELLKTPFQAVHCRLQVQPTASQVKWSETVSDIFNEIVGEPSYNMVVKELGTPLSVELVDKATNKSLSDILVEMNLAEYTSKSVSPSTRPLTSVSSIPHPDLPSVGDTVTAKVVHILSLDHFFIQRSAPWLLSQLSQISSIKSSKLKVKPGSSYLACFHGDRAYHRVTAISISNDEVKVHYVDYGNSLDLPLAEVFPIPPELVDLPALAIPCSLVGGVSDDADTAFLLQQFSALVAEQVLSVSVKGVSPTALLVSMVNEQGVDIEKELLDNQPVLPSEGESDSVVADEDSASCQEMSTSREDEEMSVCVTFVSDKGIIYGHDVSKGSGVADNLKLIDAALDIRCHALSEESTFPQVEVGQSVCAKSSEDGLWYRATVKKVKDSSAIVYYIDYGNEEEVQRNDIIPEAVLPDLRPQAVGLKLPSFRPTSEWVELLSHQLIDQQVEVKIIETTEDIFIISSDYIEQLIN